MINYLYKDKNYTWYSMYKINDYDINDIFQAMNLILYSHTYLTIYFIKIKEIKFYS